MAKQQKEEEAKVIATNRKAYHDYFIVETFEFGVVLRGTEVKALREGKANLQDSYASLEQGELWMYNLHISPFEKGNMFNHDPKRIRKLLAHKSEIRKLTGKVKEKGFTLVPLKLYFAGRHVKVEVGLAKGKHAYDKRETLKRKESEREMHYHMKRSHER